METKQIVELSKILKARLSKAIETIDRDLKLLEDCQQVDFYKAKILKSLKWSPVTPKKTADIVGPLFPSYTFQADDFSMIDDKLPPNLIHKY